MKILVLNGSPRGKNSNTMKLTTAFLEGVGIDNEIDIIDVYKKNIKSCLGCFVCWRQTPGVCVIKDDMQEIIEKYLEADMVIWSFPLYYYGLPSGLKAVLDRLLPTNLPLIESNENESSGHPPRYDRAGKKYVVISTCGFPSVKGNYEPVSLQFDYAFKNKISKIFCPEGELFKVKEMTPVTDKYLANIKQAGLEVFKNNEISKETQEKIDTLLVPAEAFVKLANQSWTN